MKALQRISLFFAITFFALLSYSCSSTTSSNDDSENGSTEFNSKMGPGDSAEDLLQADNYSSLQIEIDYMPGYEPTQKGLDSLKSFLQQHLNKDNITFREPSEIASGNQSSYSADEIRTIENSNRDFRTEASSNSLQVYFLVVDGENSSNSNVIGFAYWNTSVAFFGQTIDNASSGLGAPSKEKIEGTVFRHEFGHIMGLVGIGSPHPPGQENHQSEDSAHCNVDGCLMNAAVETGNFFENTFSGDIPDLDPLCVEDLQANGGK